MIRCRNCGHSLTKHEGCPCDPTGAKKVCMEDGCLCMDPTPLVPEGEDSL